MRGSPHVPADSIGKGGLVPLTHVLALRLGAHGVRVNCIAAAGRSTARIAGTPGTW